jgi:hypothetical protein
LVERPKSPDIRDRNPNADDTVVQQKSFKPQGYSKHENLKVMVKPTADGTDLNIVHYATKQPIKLKSVWAPDSNF